MRLPSAMQITIMAVNHDANEEMPRKTLLLWVLDTQVTIKFVNRYINEDC
jgi:hypothetical protein